MLYNLCSLENPPSSCPTRKVEGIKVLISPLRGGQGNGERWFVEMLGYGEWRRYHLLIPKKFGDNPNVAAHHQRITTQNVL